MFGRKEISITNERFLEITLANRPFPSCLKPVFQSEAECEALGFDMKMIFYSRANKLNFTLRKVLHFASFESESF